MIESDITLQNPLNRLQGANTERACIHITRFCNLRCRYCLSRSGPEIPHAKPNLGSIIKAIEWLGVRGVTVSGGEPLLAPELSDLIRLLHNSEKIETIKITTNGTVPAGDDIIEILNSTDELNVSIDEPFGQVSLHRNYRLSQKLKIADFFAQIKNKDFRKSVNIVVSKSNVTQIHVLVGEILKMEPNLALVALLPLSKLGRGESISSEEFLPEHELIDLTIRLGDQYPIDFRLLSFHKANNDYVVVDSGGRMHLPGRTDAESLEILIP